MILYHLQDCTVWKFYDLSVTQILREIILQNLNIAKLFHGFFVLLGDLNVRKFQPSKCAKIEKTQNSYHLNV